MAEKIGDNPRRSSYRQILGIAGPTDDFMWIGERCGEPHQQSEEDQHCDKQARSQKGRTSGKKGDGRKCKRKRGRNRPEHLARGNPLGNEGRCSGQIKELFGRE